MRSRWASRGMCRSSSRSTCWMRPTAKRAEVTDPNGAAPLPPPSSPRRPTLPAPAPPPLLTSDLPGIGGVFKERPEDFLVDEQPLYEPSGQGEHIYLFVEKRGMSTLRAARVIAHHFGVHVSAVGFAGLKDK